MAHLEFSNLVTKYFYFTYFLLFSYYVTSSILPAKVILLRIRSVVLGASRRT